MASTSPLHTEDNVSVTRCVVISYVENTLAGIHGLLICTGTAVYKRGSQIPFLGAAHGTDILEFFTGIDYVAVDALGAPFNNSVAASKSAHRPSHPVFFTNNLDPNAPADLESGLSHLSGITWDKYNSNLDAPPLLTFSDPAPKLEITTDTFRTDAMELLNELMLLFP